jgi:hypothetical protein
MPLLAGARSITWVQHKGRGGGQPKLATEVEILRAQLGGRFELEATDTTSFLLAAGGQGAGPPLRVAQRSCRARPMDLRIVWKRA